MRSESGFSRCGLALAKVSCSGGGSGRHKGLKIPWTKVRAGSSPALSIVFSSREDKDLFFTG